MTHSMCAYVSFSANAMQARLEGNRLPNVQRLLKLGGIVVIIDHLGKVAKGSSLGNTLHHIDPLRGARLAF